MTLRECVVLTGLTQLVAHPRRLCSLRLFLDIPTRSCGPETRRRATRLSSDPVHKLLVGRDPLEGADLASQPTLSRLENAVDRKQLYRRGERLADRRRRRLKGRARRITIDLDPTDDPTHGAQQLTFFNGHYDSWCYLPVVGFLTFNDEREPYLFTALLRPGNAVASVGAVGLLRRVLKKLRLSFPGARMRVRLDGGFAEPALLDFLEAQPDVEYVVAMAKNAVLERQAQRALRQARHLSRRSDPSSHCPPEATAPLNLDSWAITECWREREDSSNNRGFSAHPFGMGRAASLENTSGRRKAKSFPSLAMGLGPGAKSEPPRS